MLLILVLISSLLHSVDMLKCLQCADSSCQKPDSVTCAANQVCSVYQTDVAYSIGIQSSTFGRSCIPTELCLGSNTNSSTATASATVTFLNGTYSVSCCTTDNCNSGNLTAPSNAVNGLKCSSCSSLVDKVCNTTLSCVGNQDRCFNDTVSSLPFNFGINKNVTLKGCVSKSLCGPSSIGNLTCCDKNLCNKSTTWLRDFNISLLLMSLITAVFLQ